MKKNKKEKVVVSDNDFLVLPIAIGFLAPELLLFIELILEHLGK